jgi:two-component system sensor histidine kinase TctE
VKAPDHSLRRRLLARLWIPLSGVLLLGAVVSFGVAYHFGNVVHDRWLLDSAMTLATQLRANVGKVSLELSPSAVEMFEWDAVDRIYEQVTAPSGRLIFGNADFPAPPGDLAPNAPRYYDTTIGGNPVRVVAVAVASPADATKTVTIQVAETKKKREALVLEIMLALVPLQVGILLVAGAFIWFAVTSSLATLDETASRLRRYKPERLHPVRDVQKVPSEVKPLILAINQLIEKLSEAQGAQQRFVANAAHQLRTPLATLQVQTERALRETNPERHSEALADVVKAVSRMRHLTQQLLTLSRSDPSSEGTLHMTDIDLAQFARAELERWADRAVEREVDLGYEGPESGVTVAGEAQLLAELLGNLVENAIEYGGAGGRVTVGVASAPPTLFVEDDGPGIPHVERERVFEPFYRPRDSTAGGSGLGLTIAREIAARHDAVLTIADKTDTPGTRIEVVFPPTSEHADRLPTRFHESALPHQSARKLGSAV